ncbi:MAG: hypothetical protein LQ337_008520 [Flavoplaca oasis]|nr:MAG: hypothetical protein LQ337_008520 [Flavoplaca oasis]
MDPDTNISLVDANGFFSNRTGDIGLFKSDYESYLDSAVLGTTILRDHDRFSGWITNTDGDDIGHMNVERPVPDPETLFHDLVQDSLVAAIPTALRSEVDPNSLIPSPTQGCESKPTECYIVIPSADVFYFGPDPTNTACLPAITSMPPSPTPPQISMDPKWVAGIVGPPVTLSYPSGALSTLEYQSDAPPATKVFNLEDLPCPPSTLADVYDPGLPYLPILVSELSAKFNLFVDRETGYLALGEICQVAAVIDPPIHATRVGKITGAKDQGGSIP